MIEIVPPVAVNGPIVVGDDGTAKVSPVDGIGLGMGTSKLMVPDGTDPGVAPLASRVVVAVPLMETFPRAAAAFTMPAGITSWV